jgi:hypothetical protein
MIINHEYKEKIPVIIKVLRYFINESLRVFYGINVSIKIHIYIIGINIYNKYI